MSTSQNHWIVIEAEQQAADGNTGSARSLECLDTEPLVKSLSTKELGSLESRARKKGYPTDKSLTTFRRAYDTDAEQLNELIPPGYRYYLEKKVDVPSPSEDEAARQRQPHLAKAPYGIGAPGGLLFGRPLQVSLFDIQPGWDLTHPAYFDRRPELIYGDNHSKPVLSAHGSSTLSLIASNSERARVTGLLPELERIRLASTFERARDSHNHVADAICAATARSRPGDVILLTVNRDDCPPEVEEEDHLAIQLATALGVTVVEAAGNKGRVIGCPSETTHRCCHEFGDSGAILVGASSYREPHHKRYRETGTNFGKRIDCFAPGSSGIASGYGPGAKGAPTKKHRFNATSAAAAVIAGVCLAVQETHIEEHGLPLPPSTLREIISCPALGTAAGEGELIGVMPNLPRVRHLVQGYTPFSFYPLRCPDSPPPYRPLWWSRMRRKIFG